ncbi:acyltransferase [Pseudohalocynthiibacter sp. F2068]|uniref:acyltransferase family protein n=1 Tax=Pseudohalocynthiibacter sp. F2068 TaxID=2926418 RepID=UPI0032B2C783
MLGPGGFRFLLAWMVVVEHVSRFEIGKVAVMAFFTLSGFWVTRVFQERYIHVAAGIPVFYLSRFLRIWPLYIAVFLVTVLLFKLLQFPIHSNIWIALPILGVATHQTDILGVTWSLDIEVQFYLLLPIIALFLSKLQTLRQRGGFFACALLLWGVGLLLGGRYEMETVLLYLPLFLMGATMYLYELKPGKRMAHVSILVFFVMAFCAVLTPDLRPYLIYGSGSNFADKVFALFWVIFLLPFIAFNVRQKSGRIDRHLGNLSYTIYLVHFPATRIVRNLLGGDMSDIGKLLFLVFVFLVSLAFYALFEVRFEHWRRRIVSYVQTNLSFYQTRR